MKMSKMKDFTIDNPMERITGFKMKECKTCEGNGYILKDEWTGTDDSYEVEIRCECSED